jgi:dihydroorotate dehydrogenase electron transfer subunit
MSEPNCGSAAVAFSPVAVNAASFNPGALQQVVRIASQRSMARDTYCLRLETPEIASRIVPGQFFMVRPVDGVSPLLGRPFALFDTYLEGGVPVGLEFGYVVVGKLTSLMPTWKAGDKVSIWGPLGNGFPPPDANHLMLVAGGIGQTPFLAVAREALGLRSYGSPRRVVARRPRRVTLCYGVRSAEYLAGLDNFALPGLDLRLATDDGTRGHHGFITDLVKEALAADDRPDRVYCCGPEPMMHATARICEQAGVDCWLSLESPMACGFGACFSCVTAVKLDGGQWDYRRACVEGPVFEAKGLLLEARD